MDPETEARLLALLRKTAADIIADWNWPVWPRNTEPGRGDDDQPSE